MNKIKQKKLKSSSSSKKSTNDLLQAIPQALHEHYKDGKLERGVTKTVAETLNVSRNCTGQVLKRANDSIENKLKIH